MHGDSNNAARAAPGEGRSEPPGRPAGEPSALEELAAQVSDADHKAGHARRLGEAREESEAYSNAAMRRAMLYDGTYRGRRMAWYLEAHRQLFRVLLKRSAVHAVGIVFGLLMVVPVGLAWAAGVVSWPVGATLFLLGYLAGVGIGVSAQLMRGGRNAIGRLVAVLTVILVAALGGAAVYLVREAVRTQYG